MGLHTAIRVAVTALALSACLAGGAQAAEPEKSGKADQCRGVDMLAETKARDPELFSKIMAQADTVRNGDALLWKVERDGAPASYLFGTVHLTDERVTRVSPAVHQALKDSKTVALEVADLSEAATTKVIAKSAPLVIYKDGRRLDGLLTDSEYETVKKVIARSGMPVDLAASYKPWIVTMILSVSDCERKKKQEGAKVLDMQIAEIGKARGMDVVGLQSIPEQLKDEALVPEAQQLKMLRTSLKFADRTNDLMETLVQLYLNRKIAALLPFQIAIARQIGIGDDAYAAFQTKRLIDRNIRMSNAAAPLLEKGGAFIAVGALHLPGDKGLVSLLRSAGYTVTPIE